MLTPACFLKLSRCRLFAIGPCHRREIAFAQYRRGGFSCNSHSCVSPAGASCQPSARWTRTTRSTTGASRRRCAARTGSSRTPGRSWAPAATCLRARGSRVAAAGAATSSSTCLAAAAAAGAGAAAAAAVVGGVAAVAGAAPGVAGAAQGAGGAAATVKGFAAAAGAERRQILAEHAAPALWPAGHAGRVCTCVYVLKCVTIRRAACTTLLSARGHCPCVPKGLLCLSSFTRHHGWR